MCGTGRSGRDHEHRHGAGEQDPGGLSGTSPAPPGGRFLRSACSPFREDETGSGGDTGPGADFEKPRRCLINDTTVLVLGQPEVQQAVRRVRDGVGGRILSLPDRDQQVVLFTAEHDSPVYRALELLRVIGTQDLSTGRA